MKDILGVPEGKELEKHMRGTCHHKLPDLQHSH